MGIAQLPLVLRVTNSIDFLINLDESDPYLDTAVHMDQHSLQGLRQSDDMPGIFGREDQK